MRWIAVRQTFNARKVFQKYFYPKSYLKKISIKTFSRHSLLMFSVGAVSCAALSIHRSHSQFWQTPMESRWPPQDPELLHWNAAVILREAKLEATSHKKDLREGQAGPASLFSPQPGGTAEGELAFVIQFMFLTSTTPVISSLTLTELTWMHNAYMAAAWIP